MCVYVYICEYVSMCVYVCVYVSMCVYSYIRDRQNLTHLSQV